MTANHTKDDKLRTQEAQMREMYDLRVFIVGGGFQYIKMFYEAGFRGARSIEDADIVCFTGGVDVNPQLYGEKALPETRFNEERDIYETGVWLAAIEKKIPCIGICRGAQFLNVMNGGTLWQDVDNHCGHHDILDVHWQTTRNGMTSTHHQMMRPAEDGQILALANKSLNKKAESIAIQRKKPEPDDVEVVWYPSTLCLCFQPHPEFMKGECQDYFLDLVDEFVMPAC